MVHSQIILLGIFYNKSNLKLSIPLEHFNNLSQLNFDGEVEIFIAETISHFQDFCEPLEINSKDVACK